MSYQFVTDAEKAAFNGILPESTDHGWHVYEDFFGTTNTFDYAWSVSTNGAGASVAQDLMDISVNRFGVQDLITGTTNSGYAAIQLGAGTMRLGGGEFHFMAAAKHHILSVAAQRFTRRIGISDVVTTVPSNGIYFEYADASSLNWQCVCRKAGVETRVVTSVPVTAQAWNKLQFNVNAAGTSVVFTIDGVVVATITTNLPTTVSTSLSDSMIKSVGTTSRVSCCDYIAAWGNFTTAR